MKQQILTNPKNGMEYPQGIYFNMRFDEYLSIPCLQSSSVKNLHICETDFWEASWMNPWRESEDSEAKRDGRAYHVRILEGRAAFYASWVPHFECHDLGVITTSDDLKNALRDNGLPVTFRNKAEGIERLLTKRPDLPIYDVMEADYMAENEGMEFLKAQTFREIELAAKMIECNQYLKADIAGGHPEVTIIWFDEELGVWFKIRVDYLKIGQATDLKTYANVMNKSIEKAIEFAIASHKYVVQGSLYMRGIDRAKDMAKLGWVYNAGAINPEWIKLFAQTENQYFKWIFQKKGRAPASQGVRMYKDSESGYETGLAIVADAAEKYTRFLGIYQEDPWVYERPDITLSAKQLPAFAFEV